MEARPGRGRVKRSGERPGPTLPASRGGQAALQRGQVGPPGKGRAIERGVSTPLIYGRNAVLEAARAGRVLKVLQASGLGHDPRLDELARLARVEVVTPDKLDAMAPGVNQGVAAELKPRREWTLKELLDTTPSLLVALDSIMDPQNLGAILRSAEVAGCDGAIVPDHRSAPLFKSSAWNLPVTPTAKTMPSAMSGVEYGPGPAELNQTSK